MECFVGIKDRCTKFIFSLVVLIELIKTTNVLNLCRYICRYVVGPNSALKVKTLKKDGVVS